MSVGLPLSSFRSTLLLMLLVCSCNISRSSTSIYEANVKHCCCKRIISWDIVVGFNMEQSVLKVSKTTDSNRWALNSYPRAHPGCHGLYPIVSSSDTPNLVCS